MTIELVLPLPPNLDGLLSSRRPHRGLPNPASHAPHVFLTRNASTTDPTNTLHLAPCIGVAMEGHAFFAAELEPLPVKGFGAAENDGTLSARQFVGCGEMLAFSAAVEQARVAVSTILSSPDRDTTVRTQCVDAVSLGDSGASARTVGPTFPTRVSADDFTANPTSKGRGARDRVQCVDNQFSSGIIGGANEVSIKFLNLAVVFPNDAGASIHDELDHVIEVAPLPRLAVEGDPDPEEGLSILEQCAMAHLDFPADGILCLPGLARSIDGAILVPGESWAPLGQRITRISEMYADT